MEPLYKVRRRPVDELAKLISDSPTESAEAALKLVSEARNYGVGMRDFLTLAVDVRASKNPEQYVDLNGYEASLAFLKLPVRDNLKDGVTLDLASDTFQTFAGTRMLFPEVIDDIVKWTYRQDQFENATAFVSQSRTVPGVEMISTVVNDTQADYQGTHAVSEFGRVAIKTIRSSENSVKFFKHGGGYRTSYEFARRARLDMLTPFVARTAREMAMSKCWAATSILINGDGVAAAAGEVDQSSFNGGVVGTATNGTLSFKHLCAWLVSRAKLGTPVDTVIGDWDAYMQWLFMFALPSTDKVVTDAQQLAASGFQIGGVPILRGTVNFALSSAAPANKLIGLSKADTIEELVEANSLINESERSIGNQTITYVKTENTGYKLVFADTRSVFDFGA